MCSSTDSLFESGARIVMSIMSSSVSVSPMDEKTMQEILMRDQRTTCHRVRHCDERQVNNTFSSPVIANSVVMSGSNSNSKKSSILGMTTRCCGDDDCGCSKSRTRDLVVSDENTRKMHSNSNVNTVTKSCDDNEELREDIEQCCEAPSSYQLDLGLKSARFIVACSTWLRLGSLLVALLAISVHSAPMMTMKDKRMQVVPKWINPCGFAAEELEGDFDVNRLNDEVLLGHIVMQAKTALNYAQGFRDDYIKRTFNTDYADLHLTWKDNHYDWLPGPQQIPKQLSQQLDKEFLDKLEVRMLDTALLDAYEYMQRYAVGLEQIAWDQEDYGLEFVKQFKDTEFNLRSVLCELQMAMAERTVAPRADVNREVMSSEYRDMSDSATYRNLRDWLIFRDYMNGLEYIIQVFEQFIQSIRS